MTDRTPAILFVCLGNICRSPLAEAAFRKIADDAGLDVKADSAGTAAYHIGAAPDPRSIATARLRGIDITHYQGRQINDSDYTAFTHIVALDANNLADIRTAAPGNATANISLLMDFVPDRQGEAVADPYYGDDSGFEITWRDVELAAKHIVSTLHSQV